MEIVESLGVSVIITTLNEEEGIGPTIREIITTLGNMNIVTIDGGSIDATREIARGLGSKVINQHGRGKGRAVAQVLNHLEPQTKFVVLIDGDYTYPAESIPEMINILDLQPRVGMVSGERKNAESFKEHLKCLATNRYYMGNRLLTLAHRLLNRVNMKDPLTGLRVIRWECLRDWEPKASGFDIEVELNHHVQNMGWDVVEVPIKYRSRLGDKKLRVRDGFKILARMMKLAIYGS